MTSMSPRRSRAATRRRTCAECTNCPRSGCRSRSHRPSTGIGARAILPGNPGGYASKNSTSMSLRSANTRRSAQCAVAWPPMFSLTNNARKGASPPASALLLSRSRDVPITHIPSLPTFTTWNDRHRAAQKRLCRGWLPQSSRHFLNQEAQVSAESGFGVPLHLPADPLGVERQPVQPIERASDVGRDGLVEKNACHVFDNGVQEATPAQGDAGSAPHPRLDRGETEVLVARRDRGPAPLVQPHHLCIGKVAQQ